MGYRQDDDSGAIAKNLPGYEPLPAGESEIDAGMVAVADKKIATLRISLFHPSLAMCESALRKLRASGAKACDDACRKKLEARADDIFVRDVEGRIRGLMRLKPDVFLVDVAGNGGGSDTAIAIARMLGGEELNAPSMAFVRNAHRRTALAEELLSLKPALVKARGAEAAFLSELIAGLTSAQEQAGEPCDLTGVVARRKGPMHESRSRAVLCRRHGFAGIARGISQPGLGGASVVDCALQHSGWNLEGSARGAGRWVFRFSHRTIRGDAAGCRSRRDPGVTHSWLGLRMDFAQAPHRTEEQRWRVGDARLRALPARRPQRAGWNRAG